MSEYRASFDYRDAGVASIAFPRKGGDQVIVTLSSEDATVDLSLTKAQTRVLRDRINEALEMAAKDEENGIV